ncbi:MAG TPA: glycine cleavage system aminomethyltransferase GcvT [Candidatus Brocadiales bacterium]|nr:glycine cleavage system aminomethyltransferase GcvT [Candidatus Brocadiales bacterium]
MKTPLYEIHQRLGARFIEFHGYELPLEYTSIMEEHLAVRNGAGLFDLSHMGEIEVQGGNALKFLQRLITNDAEGLADRKILYTPLCNPQGGIIDDVILYRFNKERFLLVVNASNIRKVHEWMQGNSLPGTRVLDRSQEIGMIALQGPLSQSIVESALGGLGKDVANLPHHGLIEKEGMVISRSGYTGEDGFEVYAPNDRCLNLWERLMDFGQSASGRTLRPAGLGARDTLRLEAGLLLYGNDIDDNTTPLEAGIAWTVKFHKEDFIGKEALLSQKASGVKRRLVGLELLERGIPRTGHTILVDSRKIGYVTSGTFSPSLQKPIAMGYVESNYAEVGASALGGHVPLLVEIRGRQLKARIVSLPFYKRGG